MASPIELLATYVPLFLIGLVIARVVKYPVLRAVNNVAGRRRYNCSPAPKIKSRDPFLGLDIILRLRQKVNSQAFLNFLPTVFLDAGSWTVELNKLGDPAVWTADPEVIKTILATSPKDWYIGSSRKEAIDPIFGPCIITTEGDYWHETRKVMRPAFSKKQFGELGMIREHVDNFMRRLPQDGSKIDLKPLFYMLSMDVSTDFLFGVSGNNLTSSDNSDAVAFAKAFDLLQNSITKGQWVGKLGSMLFPDKELQAATQLVTSTLDRYIAKATANVRAAPEKKGEEDHYNVLEEMLRSWGSQPKRVRAESIVLLVGGRDTTAAALSNLFHYLSRLPQVWATLRAECLAAPEKPNFEELKSLRYLHDCVRESLRLVNPTVDLSRTAAVDTVLPRGGGPDGKAPLFVKKGTNFNLWIYAMQHRKDLWGEDADEFRPERWVDYRTTSWFYSPFGAGTRSCLGQQLALTETMYTAFQMARQFTTIESLDSRPWTESLGLATTSSHGNEVRLVR